MRRGIDSRVRFGTNRFTGQSDSWLGLGTRIRFRRRINSSVQFGRNVWSHDSLARFKKRIDSRAKLRKRSDSDCTVYKMKS